MWLLTIVVDMFRRRPAAEKPPLSTTRTNVVKLVSLSICVSDQGLHRRRPRIRYLAEP
jgi:hypothetical protein